MPADVFVPCVKWFLDLADPEARRSMALCEMLGEPGTRPSFRSLCCWTTHSPSWCAVGSSPHSGLDSAPNSSRERATSTTSPHFGPATASAAHKPDHDVGPQQAARRAPRRHGRSPRDRDGRRRSAYHDPVSRTVLLACLGLLNCGAPQADPTAGPATAVAAAPRSPLPDTPLLRELQRAVADCELDDAGYFQKCEGYKYFDGIGALEFADLRAAMALECRLLAEPEPELARLGLARLDWTLTALKRGGRISDDADAALLDCLRERLAAPGPLDLGRLVGVYTEFSVGLGRDDEILAFLRDHPDPEVRRAGYPRLWKFAGMRLWPTLQTIVAREDVDTATAVLAGLDDDTLTDDEQHALCTAFAAWLPDPRAPVRRMAGSHIAYRCPRYHPLLLSELRGGLARGALDDGLLPPVSHLAENCVEVGPETCEGATALLEEIALASQVDLDDREFSLFSIGRADNKRGHALARRLAAGSDPAMAGAAKRLLAQ